jgi:hypothetical protein
MSPASQAPLIYNGTAFPRLAKPRLGLNYNRPDESGLAEFVRSRALSFWAKPRGECIGCNAVRLAMIIEAADGLVI